MLQQAGIDPASTFRTNVFHIRPRNNDLTLFCTTNVKEAIRNLPSVKPGHYIHERFGGEYERLMEEVRSVAPNLILALGNTALAAFTGLGKISSVRGTLLKSRSGVKVLPTYHPSAVLRQWGLRAIVVADFVKASKELLYPELVIPKRQILISPTVFQVEDFLDLSLKDATHVAVDIETSGRAITHIGFADSPTHAISIPFIDRAREDKLYWLSFGEQLRVMQAISRVLDGPIIKIFQHGAYDTHRIWRSWGMSVRNWREDTMIQAHALYPELPKALGFLGSIYTQEPAWKIMRHRTKDEIGKREE